MSPRVVAVVSVAAALAARAPAAPPNVLLVMSDDHSSRHVGCYGNPDVRTPNLDAFAKSGVRFDRYYVASPQCVPSRAAIMTGRSPLAVQMTRFSAPLPAEYKIFPELLKEKAGYFAGVAGRSHHLDGSAMPPETKTVFDAHHLVTFPDRLDYVGKRGKPLVQFREFLAAAPAGKPWVLQLCFSDPHRPYTPEDAPAPVDPAKLTLPPFYPDTKLVREDLAAFYNEVNRFDADFGKVLGVLDERGLAGNTLVVFAGDNGAAQFRGKGTLYELGVRCPLIVRPAGGRADAPAAVDTLVSGEDLAPTFLAAAGVPAPPEMTGKSFLPVLKGEKLPPRPFVFAERGAHGSSLPTNSSVFDIGRCVVSPTHKLIYNVLWQIPFKPVDFVNDPMWKDLEAMNKAGTLDPKLAKMYFAPTRPMFEVYDLAADPAEMTNLAGTPAAAGVEKELKAALQEWMILNRDFAPLPVAPTKK